MVLFVAEGSDMVITKENEYRAALYCRLSSDDAYLGESGSIQTQEDICQGYYLQKIKAKNRIITATFSRFDVYFLILIYYNFFRTLGCPARSCHETTVGG